MASHVVRTCSSFVCDHGCRDLQARGCVCVAISLLAWTQIHVHRASAYRDGLDIRILTQSQTSHTRQASCQQAQARPWSCEQHRRTALPSLRPLEVSSSFRWKLLVFNWAQRMYEASASAIGSGITNHWKKRKEPVWAAHRWASWRRMLVMSGLSTRRAGVQRRATDSAD